MSRPRAVVVHSLSQACATLSLGFAVELVSGRGAGWYAGAAWWMALVQAARVACEGREFVDLLDCADAPGAAMAALRLGQRRLVLDAACPAYSRVAAVAATLGADIAPTRPECLDLAEPGAEHRLARWLAAG